MLTNFQFLKNHCYEIRINAEPKPKRPNRKENQRRHDRRQKNHDGHKTGSRARPGHAELDYLQAHRKTAYTVSDNRTGKSYFIPFGPVPV